MTAPLATVLCLLLGAIFLFMWGKPRMDVVGILVMVALSLSEILTVPEALAGFSDPNVILIAALFVVGDGLVRTGIAQRMGDWLSVRAGSSEPKVIVYLMLISGLLGAVMSSTGVVAIFIPIVLRIARRSRIAPGRLMMPLSFAGLIGGMLTLVATAPNLIVSGELVREGFASFRFFSFTPFGLPILVLGIGYMLVVRRWLPGHRDEAAPSRRRRTLQDFIRLYQLADRQFLVKIVQGSVLAGRALGEIQLRSRFQLSVIAVEKTARSRVSLVNPTADTVIAAGDHLLIEPADPTIDHGDLYARLGLEQVTTGSLHFKNRPNELGMAEVLLPPESGLIGQSVLDSNFRTRFRTTVVGLRRNLEAFDQSFPKEKLQLGDTLLLAGNWKDIQSLHANSKDFVVLNLPAELDELPPAGNRAPQALLSLGVMVALMISGIVPNVIAGLIGCLAMGLFRCVTMESAYRSIHWKSLILIVGMLPFATALGKTGGVDLAAQGLTALAGSTGPLILLGCVFVITVIIGLFVSNTATAVLMAPVAISTAVQMGLSPYPFAMMVALAASTSFLTPVSSPVNVLVVEPGRYRFSDFFKIGLPFSIIVLLVCLILVPWLLPFVVSKP